MNEIEDKEVQMPDAGSMETDPLNDAPLEQPTEDLSDPLEDAEEPVKKGKKEKTKKEKIKKDKPGRGHQRHRKKADSFVRIEELEKIMGEYGEDVDTDAIVSMYMPGRRAKRFGFALLHLSKLRLALLILIAAVAALFILSFMQEKMGNFTINLNRLDLYSKGISISEDGDFTNPTARLTADVVQDATNISIEDLPADLDDEAEGNHNGRNYMAYTYYVRNAGKEDVGYVATIKLDESAKGAEEAVRLAVWHNGERTVYAYPSSDGSPEDGCTNFESDSVVCTYTEDDFLVGNVDKYTIVIWMEGDDPECVDAIVGGSIEFSMKIDAIEKEDLNLFQRFARDLKDALTGNQAINAAGTDAPDYYTEETVTWDNRRNQ